MRRAILILLAAATSGCVDAYSSCPEDDSALWRPDTAPDVHREVTLRDSAPLGGQSSGTVLLEVWDCVDPNWWSDVGGRKVVIVSAPDDQCYSYSHLSTEEYACDAEDSPDMAYRGGGGASGDTLER